MDLHTEDIKSLPIWVQLPELDIKFWGNESLSKKGSCLGIPLKTDKYTKDRTMLNYARLLIDISLDNPFPNYIKFFNEDDVLIRQNVTYEWKPIKCSHCKMFGHEEASCRKEIGLRTEWRPKQKDTQGGNMSELHSSDKEKAARQPLQSESQAIRELINPFQVLDMAEIGMIGLLETKIKMENDSKIAARAFPGWNWDNNSTPNIKGRIWIACHPRPYEVQVLEKSDQILHCHMVQLNTHKKFFLTFVYGMNHNHQRTFMWEDLLNLSQQMIHGAYLVISMQSFTKRTEEEGM
ncbi:LOW QUALITY PROTEIN: hypothetical protein Cgig2_033630 [Carnegiea gigantea]|uniref:DUF4283 domain-containing protein n=1 Tax=Carnegiea gigantea TaxID=171969 RepID=A0A9Q1K483_9CARY|nr:LOW QUALITY PROTEIN: hypothetical protein Cgig2_033630 [Carnegiea gigantea]